MNLATVYKSATQRKLNIYFTAGTIKLIIKNSHNDAGVLKIR
jgi:hypothetical protein